MLSVLNSTEHVTYQEITQRMLLSLTFCTITLSYTSPIQPCCFISYVSDCQSVSLTSYTVGRSV